jgi:hypothetical protein
MLREGQQSTFPKIKFISNRRKLETVISEGLKRYPSPGISAGIENQKVNGAERRLSLGSQRPWEELPREEAVDLLMDNPEESHELVRGEFDSGQDEALRRRPSQLEELRRQSAVFFDDTDDASHSDEDVGNYQTPTRVG